MSAALCMTGEAGPNFSILEAEAAKDLGLLMPSVPDGPGS